jgi:RimJ/RimL family protein N-acetyltransferase
MQFEGVARQKYYKNGKFIDAAQYAILRSDMEGYKK